MQHRAEMCSYSKPTTAASASRARQTPSVYIIWRLDLEPSCRTGATTRCQQRKRARCHLTTVIPSGTNSSQHHSTALRPCVGLVDRLHQTTLHTCSKGFNVTLPTPRPTRRISTLSDPSHTRFSLDQPPTITHHARHTLALEQWLLTSELTPLFVRTRHTLKRTFTVAATSLQTSRGAGCRNARRRRSVFLRARHSTSPREARQAPIYNPCHKSPGAEAARDAMRRERSERAEAARTPGIQHRREHRLRSQ